MTKNRKRKRRTARRRLKAHNVGLERHNKGASLLQKLERLRIKHIITVNEKKKSA